METIKRDDAPSLVRDDSTETAFLKVQGLKDWLLDVARKVVVASVANDAGL